MKKNRMQLPGKNYDRTTKKTAFMGMMLAAALILAYVESLIPFDFGIPGVKLGLPNLCTVMLLYLWGPWEAGLINILRIIISGFMFGNLSMIIYSLAGGILSFAAMFLMKKLNRFGLGGVSLVGGIMHNIGQCLVACFAVSDIRVAFYLPALLIAGALTGLLIGFVAHAVVPRLRKVCNI